ncbi:hypothetical protein [Halorussus sp. MSC15.2]|uniref:hypothetical protein n=1 Tax=Halorussus sp. MSC15.2 TaxID=2283638 RepID=UPI0013D3FD47|nr:hypothetical protein [Halorussus sp. MSC15.2]NEU57442.1 hypothetical protein [Halorussus sp. MSC15.2]
MATLAPFDRSAVSAGAKTAVTLPGANALMAGDRSESLLNPRDASMAERFADADLYRDGYHGNESSLNRTG